MSADLTISIVNYNSKRFILNCLESIHAYSDGLDAEVYVVDNSSTDGSVEITKKLYPKVKLILNKDNRGFARANNQVLRIADSRYCLIANPDVIFLRGVLKATRLNRPMKRFTNPCRKNSPAPVSLKSLSTQRS